MMKNNSKYSFVTLLIFMLVTLTVKATDFTVNSLADTNTGAGTSGTLRWCINQANATGSGPHSIAFSVAGTIAINSVLPVISVSDLTIDAGGTITIDAQGGNIARDHFNLAAGADNTTLRGFILKNTGNEPIQLAGTLDGVTIEDIIIQHDVADWVNYGIFVGGAVSNMTIRNVTMNNLEFINSANYGGIYFNSTTTNVLIENVTINLGGGQTMGIRFVGAANGITINNTLIDADDVATTDDSNYGIYFNVVATNVNFNNVTVHDAEVHGFYIGGIATDISIANSTFDNFDGGTTNQMVRFNAGATNITMTNVTIDEDVNATTNDGDYGIWFNSDATSNITLTNVNINEADEDGIHFFEVDDLTITGGSFNNSNEGIEFYNNGDRSNNVITGATFDGNIRTGILINVANATTEFNINNNIFSNTTGDGRGIRLYSTGGIKDIQITNNTFFDNLGPGIYNEQADGVLYSQNLFYNNAMGIDNVANNGNNDLEQVDGDTPTLYSSIDAGGGNYDVTFTLPAFCTDCDVEFFTNQAGDNKYNGRTYTDVAIGLSAAGNPHTITVNGGGATDGFWTTTLKDNTQNGSVSEFSKSVAINPKGPANVDAGIALWARADISGQADGNFTVGNGWLDFSGNENHYQQAVASDPELVSNVINFNHSVVFDGNDYLNQLNIDLNVFPTGNDDRTVFIVSKITATSSESAFSYGRNATSQNQSWRYENGTMRYIGWGNDFTGVGAFTVNEAFIGRYDHNGTTASINSDGREVSTSPRTYNTLFSTGSSHIGTRITVGAEAFIGDISEVIVYNRNLTDAEKNRVESYLALKYGITLDQTVATDYFASDGVTKVWDATANAVYTNEVTGIGKDDDGFFNQKQSKSISDDAVVTIGLGEIAVDNPSNANTFAADKNFLVWGNDDASTDLQTTELPGGALALYRLGREWKVQETGSVNNLTIEFSGVASSSAYNLELYVDTDGDFSNATIITGGTNSNGTITFAGVDLDDGDLFTLGITNAAPGGIVNNLNLWMRSDKNVTLAGTDVTAWGDYSPQAYNFDDGAASRYPTYKDNGINFNPAFTFVNGDEIMNTDNITLISQGTQESSVFVVALPTTDRGIFIDARFSFAGSERGWFFNRGGWSRPSTSLNLGIGDNSNRETGAITGTLGNIIPVNKTGIYAMKQGATNVDASFFVSGKSMAATKIKQSGNLSYVGSDNATRIGRDNEGYNANFVGEFAETIVYDRKLTATEIQVVNTYLAIKYAITLNQIFETNYLASDASIIWDATTNAVYSNDITGIGRDDLSALDQKQSKSINDDAIVTIGLGAIEATNAANTNTFTADKNFLLWGNDDVSTDLQTTELSGGALALYRLGREWKVQETGTVSNLTISFSNLSLSHLATNYELYVDTDGDGNFTNATVITGGIESGGVVTFTGVDLNNGDVFTLGLTQPFPGGVAANLQLWLGADSGITEVGGNDITQWLDINGANTPVFYGSDPDVLDSGSDLVNFNPVVHFDNDDFIRWDGNSFMNGSAAGELFMMGKEANPVTTDHNHLFDFGGGSNPHYTYSNQYIYEDFGSLDRKVWRPNIPALSLSEGTANGATLTSGIPAVNTTDYNIYNLLSEINNWQSAFNGFTHVTDVTNTVNFTGIHHLGASSGAASNGGRISEIVLYDRVLLTNERERVNTYLAIKYGNTLGHDYYASDWNGTTGTTLWTLGGGYDNDIAGIGQDDTSLLNQKQSKSVNDDALVTIGLGTIATTNIANTNTFTNDKNFLVWGNDDASTAIQTTELPTGTLALQRLGREWKVEETGAVSNLTVSFNVLGISSLTKDFELYVDTDGDGDFTNATVITGGIALGEVVTFTGVNLNNNDVFTLGYTEAAPGGVLIGLDFWLDPAVNVVTSGTSVTQWNDKSMLGNNPVLAQGTASLSPTFSSGSSSSNFNPYVDFTSNTRLHQTVTGSNYARSHSTFAAYRNNQAAPGSIYAHFLRFSSASNSDGGSHRWGFGYNTYPAAKSVGIHYISAPFSSGSLGSYTTYQYNQYNTSKEWATGTTGIVSAIIDQAGSQTIMGFDGNESVNNVTINNSGLTPYNYLTVGGGSTYGQRGWGQEIIEYSRALSLIERQKVNTYLAIKYGITLDQISATDYLTSDASVIWNAIAHAAYSNDIAGIGRDDLSALAQKQSKSVNTDAIVTMGLGTIEATNIANANAFTNDKNFLVWGNDDASTSVVNTAIPSAFSEKVARNWLVNETGAVGSTLVQIPNSAVAGFSNTTELMLFVADDAGFITNLVTVPLVQNGTDWEATIDFNGIKYFSFGIVAPSDFMRHGKTFQSGAEQPMKF